MESVINVDNESVCNNTYVLLGQCSYVIVVNVKYKGSYSTFQNIYWLRVLYKLFKTYKCVSIK